jgi:streptogramin lyase
MLFRLSTLNRHSTRRGGNQHRIRRRLLRLEGLEERCLMSGISGITEFALPSPASSLTGITAGPDGNLWFADRGSNAIGMINPTTRAISLFPIPTANCWPDGIAVGSDGNIWFTEAFAPGGGKIGEINPTTHVIKEFALPNVGIRYPRGITAGPGGNLWFAWQGGAIGEINPTTHAINYYPENYQIFDITAGPDGNVWFSGPNQVGDFNPTTDAISFFPTPSGAGVGGITEGPDGNVWFSEDGPTQFGMINPTTDVITEFGSATSSSSAYQLTAGPDGNIWFTDPGTGSIGTFNLTTDAITEYPVPYTSTNPVAITAGPDGNVWFTDSGTNAIGVATLATPQLVVTQPPPASVTAGASFGLTVEAEDSSGNLLSSFDGTVSVAIATNPGGATLGGTLTATASSGVATFSGLTMSKAASGYTLVVSASGLGSGLTSSFTVTPAAASQLVITSEPPAGVTAGSGFGFVASIEDEYGNVETGDNSDTVSSALASGPGGATLGGNPSATVREGMAAFSGLTLTKAAAGYTLGAYSGTFSATSSALSVTPAAATELVITQQPPASVVVNSGFGLQASVEDEYGNVVTSAASTVKVALASSPAGAKLGGTVSLKASKGVATFSGLTLNKVGTGYTLELTSSGLSSAITSAIAVTNTAGISMAAVSMPADAPDPLLAPLVVDSEGFLESLGVKKRAGTV